MAVAVPRGANLEAWKLTLSNNSSHVRKLAILPAIPTGLLGLISHESRFCEESSGIIHDSFPYYVKIPDHAKMARRWNTTLKDASVTELSVFLNGNPCSVRIPWSQSAEAIELKVMLSKKDHAPL